MSKPVYQCLSVLVSAIANCKKNGNSEWLDRHENAAISIVKEYMPRGSGIDAGTYLNLDKSTEDRLVFTTSFHHMDDNGSYACWTDHTVIVTPSLHSGFNLKITGRDRNQIKEYLYDLFGSALHEHVPDHGKIKVA